MAYWRYKLMLWNRRDVHVQILRCHQQLSREKIWHEIQTYLIWFPSKFSGSCLMVLMTLYLQQVLILMNSVLAYYYPSFYKTESSSLMQSTTVCMRSPHIAWTCNNWVIRVDRLECKVQSNISQSLLSLLVALLISYRLCRLTSDSRPRSSISKAIWINLFTRFKIFLSWKVGDIINFAQR